MGGDSWTASSDVPNTSTATTAPVAAPVANQVTPQSQSAAGMFSRAASNTGNFFSNAAQRTGQALSNAASATRNAASEAGHRARDMQHQRHQNLAAIPSTSVTHQAGNMQTTSRLTQGSGLMPGQYSQSTTTTAKTAWGGIRWLYAVPSGLLEMLSVARQTRLQEVVSTSFRWARWDWRQLVLLPPRMRTTITKPSVSKESHNIPFTLYNVTMKLP